MRMVQGTTSTTRLVHVLRQLRGEFLANVRAGRCKADPKALAAFDQQLERINGHTKKVFAKP